ncbi:hypothetical protein [Terriglobus sp. RCC_193]|uniref:hypothetical protein n=1 Tax=Terriglobus sp. RCC_193 TaxID=3239218 RepID=UPI0035237178
MQYEIDDRRIPEGGRGGGIPRDSGADDGEDAAADDGANAQRSERNGPQRFFQRCFRALRFVDEFIDGLRGKDLSGQGGVSRLNLRWLQV